MEVERVRNVIAQMTLREKTSLAGGGSTTCSVDRLKVDGIDFGSGVLPYNCVQPSALALGCTFSHGLCAMVGKDISVDAARARAAFAGVVGCGLIRDPMRIDAADFFSEDPLLCAELLKSYASAGVIGYVFTDALGQGRFENRTVDMRALYELYLYPLAKAGKYAAALQLDGGYLNGKEVGASRTWCDIMSAFVPGDAMVMTQWGAALGARGISGSGAYMLGAPTSNRKEIEKAIVNGTIFENRLNHCLERLMMTVAKTHDFYKKPFDRNSGVPDLSFDTSVLLKNDGILPNITKNLRFFGDARYFSDSDSHEILPIKTAQKKSGAVNVFLVSGYEKYGIDGETLTVIENTDGAKILVLCGACATPITVADNVNAVLFCPYCTSASAIATMLTTVAPRGKLPFTWCNNRLEYPRNNKKYAARGDFRYESVYNGYALLNNFGYSPMFPFGHGLDYTSYDISKPEVSCDGPMINVAFVIKNIGACPGMPVCQVYISQLDGKVYGRSRRLAAFKRVALEKTENVRVELRVNLADFAVYDERNNAMQTIGGKYRLEIGLSSKDIRAFSDVKAALGSRVNAGLTQEAAPSYYNMQGKFDPTAPEVEKLLKVPFIKAPDEHPDIDPPEPAVIKRDLKTAQKTTPQHLLSRVLYKIETTPKTK